MSEHGAEVVELQLGTDAAFTQLLDALAPEPDAVSFCRLSHFGGWLRLAGEVPRGGAINVIAYVSLKE